MSFFFFLPFFFFFSPPFSWALKQAKTLAVCGGGSSCHLASSRGGGILKGKMKCLINLLSAHVCRIAFTHRWKWWKGIVCIAALQFQSGEKSQGPTEPCSAKLIWQKEHWSRNKNLVSNVQVQAIIAVLLDGVHGSFPVTVNSSAKVWF